MILVHTLRWATLEFYSNAYIADDRTSAIEYAVWTLKMIPNFSDRNCVIINSLLKGKTDWETETIELEGGFELEYDWGWFIIRWITAKWYASDYYCRFDKCVPLLEFNLQGDI